MLKFDLKGVFSSLRFGKGGGIIGWVTDHFEVFAADGTTRAPVSVGDAVNLDDAVTKRQLLTSGSVIVTGQIDGGSPPVVVPGAIYICTTAGGSYTAGTLYLGEGSSWTALPQTDGRIISVTVDLTGGTLEFSGDHLYEWDDTGSVWVDIGPAGSTSLSGLIKTVSVGITNSSSGAVNVGSALPAGARVIDVRVDVTTAFDTAATVAVGDAGSANRLAATGLTDLQIADQQSVTANHTYGSSTQVTATVTNASATTGAATVTVFYIVP